MTITVKLGQCFICGFDCKRNDPLRHVTDGKNDDSVAKAKEEEYSYGIEEYTVPKVDLLGEKFDHYPQDLYGDQVKDAKLKDLLWIICYMHSMQKSRCISEENRSAEMEEKVNNNDRLEDKFATWNVFNSLASSTRQQTDTEVLSPLIRTSQQIKIHFLLR